MAEFFLELFSEEIPARMQRAAAQELLDICNRAFFGLEPKDFKTFWGPRRIALSATISSDDGEGSPVTSEMRGPREGAPPQAVDGFLKKFGGERSQLVIEDGYYILRRNNEPRSALEIIKAELPKYLNRFSWPKSMRWGQSGDFTWVRPLRRMICLLDGEVIPITLGPVTAGRETEGHRFMAPGSFDVSSVKDWEEKLYNHKVIADYGTRAGQIGKDQQDKLNALDVTLVQDPNLLVEISGLVEWPVPLIGKIETQFMDLPPEVRELSMKVNQRYFALRDKEGRPAPYFLFVANIEAPDGGQAIIAGNERVLRARLSDARHFWDLDLKTPLNELLPKLAKITFHADIGTQLERAERIGSLSSKIADALNAAGYESVQAGQAGRLCKADLVTGMVGEFPELQGIMGGYYAERHMMGWDGSVVGPAIKTHYQPRGPSDAVPTGIVAVSVALADKLDTLIQFFAIGQKPTGSGDPYALRRAALGVIRIILENQLTLPLRAFVTNDELFGFIIERLRVKLRGEGQRFDVLDAVMGAALDDNLSRVMRRVEAISAFLTTEDGMNLLVGYRRAANILRIEEQKDGVTYHQVVEPSDFSEPAAVALSQECKAVWITLNYGGGLMEQERFTDAMLVLAKLRPAIDRFFTELVINDPKPELRRNRLRLLSEFCDRIDEIADFSKIEG